MKTITFFTKTDLIPLQQIFSSFFRKFLKESTGRDHLSDLKIEDLLIIKEKFSSKKNKDLYFFEIKKGLDDLIRINKNKIENANNEIIEAEKKIKQDEERVKMLENSSDMNAFIYILTKKYYANK